MSVWDMEGALDYLLERYVDGDSSGVMSDKVSAKFNVEISRSAIIGKIDRMGWNVDPKITAERRKNGGAVSGDANLQDRAASIRSGKAKRGGSPTFNRSHQPARPPTARQVAVAAVFASEPLPAEDTPPANLKTFAEIGPGDCRFIYGDPREPDHGFCPNSAVPGQSWCALHTRRVHQQPEMRPPSHTAHNAKVRETVDA